MDFDKSTLNLNLPETTPVRKRRAEFKHANSYALIEISKILKASLDIL
jgi:hypothetical protein